jgi:hypothetical protein
MMLRAGADVVTLSRMLGHGSLPVVMRYLKQESGDLKRVHDICSPADQIARQPVAGCQERKTLMEVSYDRHRL